MSRGQTTDWLWSVVITCTIAVTRALPVPNDNELVYLTLFRQRADPSYLPGDWTFGTGFSEQAIFDSVLIPLARILDLEVLVWAARIVSWLVSARLLVAIGRRLGTPPAGVALAVALFIGATQSMGVGTESLFAGFEAKMVAWPVLLAALLAAVDQKVALSASLVGICTTFHPAIGLWGGGAILLALLLMTETRRRAISALPIALLFSLPGVVPVLLSMNTSAMPEAAARFIALERIPHHVDPLSFGERGPLVLALMLGFNLLWSYSRRGWFEGKLLGTVQAILAAVMVVGFIARFVGFYDFLLLTPFRVLPVLTPVLFWLIAIGLVLELRDRTRNHKLTTRMDRSLLAFAALTGVVLLLLWNPAARWLNEIRELSTAWSRQPSEIEETMIWVSNHTEEQAVIASPPWEDAMFHLTERAQMVSWGAIPYDRATEWMQRLDQTLAEDLEDFFAMREITTSDWHASYERLEEADWIENALDFGVTHVVTTAEYHFPLLYARGGWRVYRIPAAPLGGEADHTL